MRRILALLVTAVCAVYILGAAYFFRQESWARDPSGLAPEQFRALRHPDAVLGVLEVRFQARRFGGPERPKYTPPVST